MASKRPVTPSTDQRKGSQTPSISDRISRKVDGSRRPEPIQEIPGKKGRLNVEKTNTFIVVLTALFLHTIQLSASEPIRPYLKSGKSGHFRYAVYNNRWLSHGQRWLTEKHITRVAITGVLPEAKGKIVIPSSIDAHEVYGIDDRALTSCRGVTGITIPKTVRFLKPGTLNRCQGLENIVVAKDHPEFASVDGVMFDKKKTRLLAFGSGRSGHYKVPETTTAIGPGAFSLCINLRSVVIPASVSDIGGHTGGVFMGCKNLERIGIPDTVTNIGQKSFQDCRSLKTITIPPKVTAIPFGLFWRCASLTSVTLPDGITTIGNYAFAGCTKVTLKCFPKKLTTIGAYAFKDCKGLKDVTVPKSVTTIGKGAFRGCDVDMAPSDNKHPKGMAYEKLVVVNTKKENGQTRITCRLPQLQFGELLYRVKNVSVKDANQKQIATTHGTSTVTVLATEEQLLAIKLDATYIDARSFNETTRDPDRRIDWSVRFIRFKMRDILKSGYSKD